MTARAMNSATLASGNPRSWSTSIPAFASGWRRSSGPASGEADSISAALPRGADGAGSRRRLGPGGGQLVAETGELPLADDRLEDHQRGVAEERLDRKRFGGQQPLLEEEDE